MFGIKKTYLVALIVGARAVAEALGYAIPPFIDPLLAALGLAAGRHAISKVEQA